jgi:hypothetical protein
VSFIFDVFIRVTKSKRIRWSAYVMLMVKENVYRVLVAKSVVKRTLGRLRGWWEDNVATYLKEIEMWREGGALMDLAQDKDKWRARVYALMNLWVPRREVS